MASGYSRIGDESRNGPQRTYGTVAPAVGFAPSPRSGTEFFKVKITILHKNKFLWCIVLYDH